MPLRRLAALLPPSLVLAAGLLAWWGVWRGQFLFDDLPAIVDNVALQDGDWWNAAFGSRHQPLANRPFACLTLVLDFAVFGEGPFGPHLTNLLLHLLNALLVGAVARQALLAPNLAGRVAPDAARWIATAIACLWVAHPLAGDAVAYATQRSTLLASGCLLLALLATARRPASPRPRAWQCVVVGALVLGMASKEDFVVAPLLVVLFERAFVLPNWAAMRARAGWYGVLALSWGVLGASVALGPRNPTVGYDTALAINAWQWLLTQAGIVVHYARLAAVPWPLRGAHGWDVVRELGPAILPGLVVVSLLASTIVSWRRHPWWGWLGALFFLWLAPTSSVLPIETELAAERRMYLPMLAVIVPAVFGARALVAGVAARQVPWAAATAAVVVLSFASRVRVAVYADGPSFWGDAYAKLDPASRSFGAGNLLMSQAMMASRRGRFAEADELLDRAMQCDQPVAITVMQWAISQQRRGKAAEAIATLRRLATESPEEPEVLGSLGTCLLEAWQAERAPPDDPRIAEAEDALRRALAQKPRKAAFWNSLANALLVRGRVADAEDALRHVTELTTEHAEPFFRRAELLQRLGRSAEIAPMFEALLAARPGDGALRARVAQWTAGR